jgi:hypothetical protein
MRSPHLVRPAGHQELAWRRPGLAVPSKRKRSISTGLSDVQGVVPVGDPEVQMWSAAPPPRFDRD